MLLTHPNKDLHRETLALCVLMLPYEPKSGIDDYYEERSMQVLDKMKHEASGRPLSETSFKENYQKTGLGPLCGLSSFGSVLSLSIRLEKARLTGT